MKVWPIDPLVPRNLRLEVPEKLPQGLTEVTKIQFFEHWISGQRVGFQRTQLVPGLNFFLPEKDLLLRSSRAITQLCWLWLRSLLRIASVRQHSWMRGTLVRSLVPKHDGNTSCVSLLVATDR
jgi:hypothetical protein